MSSGLKVVQYTLLPGLWPRLHELLGSGFAHIAFLIAVVYRNVGLLPDGHAYLNTSNFGRYGIRHVIAAASQNLEYSKKNADKIIIFFTIIIGLILLLLQFVLGIMSVILSPAFASATWSTFLTTVPYGPDQDLAFIVLDQIFGIKNFTGTTGFFNSCYSNVVTDCLSINNDVMPSPAVYPQPFHIALHQMFLFYSLGIGFISLIVIMYCVVAIVGETIMTGKPFGQRINKAWLVPRLIFFFALITPMHMTGLNAGINAAQFVTLGAAKFGSNLATNAWLQMANSINTTYASDGASTLFGAQPTVIAFPNVPSVAKLNQFMFLVRMCMYAHSIVNNTRIYPFIVRPPDTSSLETTDIPVDWKFYFDTSFAEAVEFSKYGNVIIRFGEMNTPIDPLPGSHEEEWAYIKPTCGELVFEITSTPKLQQLPTGEYAPDPVTVTDPVVTGYIDGNDELGIQENYYVSIGEYLLFDPTYNDVAFCMLKAILPYDPNPACLTQTGTHDFNTDMWSNHGAPGTFKNIPYNSQWLTRDLAKNSINYYDAVNRYYLTGNFTVGATSYSAQSGPLYDDSTIGILRANYDFTIPPEVLRMGWVGASAYYGRIAEINGNVFAAVQNLPTVGRYPLVMEQVASQHDQLDIKPARDERFSPTLQSGKLVELSNPEDQYIASALYSAYKFWEKDNLTVSNNRKASYNTFVDMINLIVGTNGLFSMLENTDVHPLAQLSGLGKGILDASIRNIFGGAGAEIIGSLLKNSAVGALGSFANVAGGFITKVGMLGISIGFILYYVLPILPFIYFFFAFGGWVKAIFEAMVAVPLWALAHIKLDGNGLPGPWATNGYFLLFEIFLRPTLIIFGFIASITVFAAMVKGLNSVYDVVLLNIAGYDLEQGTFAGAQYTQMGTMTQDVMRGPIDQLFFTAIYAVIVYMIGLGCFKLIDQIPRSILRWMGVAVTTFQERSNDPGAQLTSRMFRTSQVTKAQLQSAIDRLRGAASSATTERDLYIQQGKGGFGGGGSP